jgi:hypothetical protein
MSVKSKPYTDQPRTPTGLMARSHAAGKKREAKQGKSIPKQIMETAGEVADAFVGGMRGSQRASENPMSESYRAQQRQGKAYGGRTKMMCGGKGKKK